MVIKKYDKKYKFKSMFNTQTGTYIRTGVLDENGNDTGVDPFMSSFPELIDIGIMGHCAHGLSGKCAESGIQCYQHGDICRNANMSLVDYKSIIDECKGKTFQVALGGCGDPDMHENFEEILKYTRDNDIVPNFTTSGFGMNSYKAAICNRYCGAVAVSMYSRLNLRCNIAIRKRDKGEERVGYRCIEEIPVKFTLNNTNPECYIDAPHYIIDGKEFNHDELHHIVPSDLDGRYELYRVYEEVNGRKFTEDNKNYTFNTIETLIKQGVTTNIHFVLSNDTIDEAILRLKYNGFPSGINAVVFLLHKPVGLGQEAGVLKSDDVRVREFFDLVDTGEFPFKIGFDSCTVPGILNFMHNVSHDSIDTCEAARWSMYITPDMLGLPCSFDNQDLKYAVDIKSAGGIKAVWDSEAFEKIRDKFKTRCPGCKDRLNCFGGCPLMDGITLCNNVK